MKDILVKSYFYLNQGVGVLNQFRNLFLAIFGVYLTLKLTSPILIVVMFIVSVPILIVVGYYNIHKIAKTSEQLSIKYGTHYGIKQFELMEEQVRLLKEILEKK